jgi:hypothetical protein
MRLAYKLDNAACSDLRALMNRPFRAATILAVIAPCLCGACGSSVPALQTDGGDGGQAEEAGIIDAGIESGEAGLPRNMPQISSLAVLLADAGSPVVLPSPKIVPIFFAKDDPSTTAQLTAFLSEVVSSSYWAGVVSEYGVGAATIHAPVQLTAADDPGSMVDDSQIKAWLTQKLDSNDPSLPPADKNTVYVFFYPAGTTVTFAGSTSDGHHTYTNQNVPVPYAVVPRVSGVSASGFVGTISLSGPDFLTFATSHELVEAVADPLGTGYFGWDAEHEYWFDFLGAELADACEFSSPAKLGNGTVARIWSNKAAALGSDPCVPALPGDVYFNSAAVLDDSVSFALPFPSIPPVSTKGVHIPVGQSATVELDLFSSAPTTGPWSVSAVDLASLEKAPAQLQFTFDKTSGQAGDKLHVTIHVLSAGQGNAELFEVVSTLGSQTHYWFGIVGN